MLRCGDVQVHEEVQFVVVDIKMSEVHYNVKTDTVEIEVEKCAV